MKCYSKEMLDIPANGNFAVIITFRDNDVEAGRLGYEYGKYRLTPLTTNRPSTYFSRSQVKQLVYINNGLILPKEKHDKQVILDILELSELLNKAGYEFI